MRPISVAKLKPGQVLGTSLFNDKCELLLVSGFRVTKEVIAAFGKRGITRVFIMDDLSKELKKVKPEKMISKKLRDDTSNSLEQSFNNLKETIPHKDLRPESVAQRISQVSQTTPLLKVKAFQKNVYGIMMEVVEKNITMFAAYPAKSDKKLEHKHAIDTTLLAIMMARAFNYSFKDLRILGTAAILHDVGKSAFLDILNKPVKELSFEERSVERQHPFFSMQILQESEPFTFIEQATILQHHEQANGAGYPNQIKSSGAPPRTDTPYNKKYLHPSAEILAVANLYDNLINGSYDGTHYKPENAIVKIVNREAGFWNEAVVQSLVNSVQCYPRGSTVRVIKNSSEKYTGYRGIVMKSNLKEQSKPVLCLTHNALGTKIKPFIFDFSSQKTMEIGIQ
ncbi:MAG: HD domain-containing protein [Candidatus Electryonea clarkiae]|nr:HD domain-containing protein [Candidatus Electryonea clarkiae]MDP8288174.1 HD domain-containing protein [Candidatus Electryonea clarkiae]